MSALASGVRLPATAYPIPVGPSRSTFFESPVCRSLGRVDASRPRVTGPGRLEYAPWRLAYPRFVRGWNVQWWESYEVAMWRRQAGCAVQDGWLHFCESSYARGSVTLEGPVATSASPMDHDCGPNGNFQTLVQNAQIGALPQVFVDTLFFAVIPATWTFQHWMENTLPKIAQALEVVPDLLQWRNVTANQELLLDRFPIIERIYEHLGWNVIDERFRAVAANKVVYSCVTPPLHPYLWQRGQEAVLRVPANSVSDRRKLVYCGRTVSGRVENAGREVRNEGPLLALLGAWGDEFEVEEFDHRQYASIQDLIAYFRDVRGFLGPHGGCLANLLFLPCNSFVVELFPLVDGIRPPLGHPGMMYYMQASFLEHDYWMLPIVTNSPDGNMDAPLDELCEILVGALGRPRGDPSAETDAVWCASLAARVAGATRESVAAARSNQPKSGGGISAPPPSMWQQ